MKPPAYIRRFRDSIAKQFGVPKRTVDMWAREGLARLGEMRTSSDPVDREFYQTIARVFVPAYLAGVQTFRMGLITHPRWKGASGAGKPKNLTKNKKK